MFRQISIAKMSHDLWNTGQQKKLFDHDAEGLCPICKMAVETADHVYQCPDIEAVTMRRKLLQTLYDEIDVLGPPGIFTSSIKTGLDWWLLEAATPLPRAPGFGRIHNMDVWATNAYAEQTQQGWGQMMRGRISLQWGEAFVKGTKSNKRKESHLHWTKLVIISLW
jgi:hypothetical protein